MDLLPELNTLTVGGIGLSVLLVFLTQAIKGWIPSRFHTVIPLILGIVVSLVLFGLTKEAFVGGLVLGIIATGEYRVVHPPKKEE